MKNISKVQILLLLLAIKMYNSAGQSHNDEDCPEGEDMNGGSSITINVSALKPHDLIKGIHTHGWTQEFRLEQFQKFKKIRKWRKYWKCVYY